MFLHNVERQPEPFQWYDSRARLHMRWFVTFGVCVLLLFGCGGSPMGTTSSFSCQPIFVDANHIFPTVTGTADRINNFSQPEAELMCETSAANKQQLTTLNAQTGNVANYSLSCSCTP